MNTLQVTGFILIAYGVYVLIKGIGRAVSSNKRRPHLSRKSSEKAFKSAISVCPKCQNTLKRNLALLKCKQCWFFFPRGWVFALLATIPLTFCAFFIAKWIIEAEKDIETDAVSGIFQSLLFWFCLGLFVAMNMLSNYSDKLTKGMGQNFKTTLRPYAGSALQSDNNHH